MPAPTGAAPLPADAVLDAARIAALARTALLDTEPEAAFDRLTALTARVAGAPVSLVALVDRDRSYFKSAHGVPEVPPGRAVPLSHSLCRHVVSRNAPLVIDDARTHPLVRDNGGVTDLGVGAYLGVPVRSGDGHVLGSLCAIDLEPRAWTAEDQASVVALAASVESEIALRAEVAERRRTEAEALAHAETLQTILRVNAALAAELDPDRLVEAVVEAGAALTGAAYGAFVFDGDDRPAVVVGACPCEIVAARVPGLLRVSPDDRDAARCDDLAALAGEPDADGPGPCGSALAVAVCNAERTVCGTLVFGHPDRAAFDASDEHAALAVAHQAAIALENAHLHRLADDRQRHLESVLASVNDVVFQTDLDGRYTFLNGAWAERTGHAVDDALGRSFVEYDAGPPGALAARYAAAMADAAVGAAADAPLQVEIRCADGSTRHFSVRGRATFDADGAPAGSAGTMTDETGTVLYHAEREAREQAEAARAEAERMSRLQAAFLANMSHEIRTPLTAILGVAEFLQDEVEPDLRDMTDALLSGGYRLEETMLSLLELAQLQADRVAPSPADTTAAAVVERALAPFRAQAEGRGLAVSVDVASPAAVVTDGALLGRALGRLVSNAVKFTEAGRVAVRARHADGVLTVEVEDTGIGIDAAVLPTLFDAFQQASSGDARSHEGPGLGLTVARHLAGALGGELGGESAPGRGSRFWIAVPAPLADGVGAYSSGLVAACVAA